MPSPEGFLDLAAEFEELIKKTENFKDTLNYGAKTFVKDLLKLPKPKSKLRKPDNTRLINTFTYADARTRDDTVNVGWGVYYGRMVEKGTVKMKAQPHLMPTWQRNQNKYYKKMIEHIGLD